MTENPRDSLTARLRALPRPAATHVAARALAEYPEDPARESLSTRLRAFRSQVPVYTSVPALSHATAPAGATVRPPLLRRWRLRIVVIALVVAVNSVATYLVPVYADALGHMPGVGDFLRWSGLSARDLTTVDVGTDHDGVRLHVAAAYADENRTVIFLDVSGPRTATGSGGFPEMTLTDQFGHTYAETAAGWGIKGAPQPRSGDDVPGYTVFTPITGAAVGAGARLTLAAHNFQLGGGNKAQQPASLTGTWAVSFIVERHPAARTSWHPATIAGATYTFGHVTITSGSLVEIAWRAAGPAVRAANLAIEAEFRAEQPPSPSTPSSPPAVGAQTAPHDPMRFVRPFEPELIDASGRPVSQTPALGSSGSSSEDWLEWTFNYILKPGQYRFVLVRSDGGFQWERDLTVP
jgi:hypothetical protein